MRGDVIERYQELVERLLDGLDADVQFQLWNESRKEADEIKTAAAAQSEIGWFLPSHCVNSLQRASINSAINTCKRAHYTNLTIRINGEDKTLESDWVKSMAWWSGTWRAAQQEPAP